MGNVVGESFTDVRSIAQESQCDSTTDEKSLSEESSGEMQTKTDGSHASALASVHERKLFSVSAVCSRTNNSTSPEPCNSSSLLPNSDLVDTLSIPLNPADAPADPYKVDMEVVFRQEKNEVVSTSQENGPALGRLSDDSKLGGSVMAEQSFRLGSTVTNVLMCPGPVPSVESAHKLPRLLELEQMTTKTETPDTELAHAQKLRESNTSAVACIPENLPLLVTTYADATNLAKQYPERAKEILTHPLLKPRQQISNPEMGQLPSPSLHHPDRPNWAAAPFETVSTRPMLATSGNDEDKSTKARRRRANRSSTVDSSSRGARRDRRHEPLPQNTIHKADHPASGISSIERLSAPSGALINGLTGGSDNTCTSTFQTQDLDCGPSAVDYSDTLSITSSGHSNVGAPWEIFNDWASIGANLRNDSLNATDVSPDRHDTFQQEFKSGSDRLGQHVISPHIIDPFPEQRRISRRVHKQQVSELNTATLRYLGKELTTCDRGIQTTPSGLNWGGQSAGYPDKILNKRFNRLSRSVTRNDIQPQRDPARFVGEASTPPKPGFDACPSHDIKIQTVNNPKISTTTPCLNSKPNLFLASKSRENHTPHNTFYGSASDLLPVQHTVEDWLLPRVPRRARTQAPRFADGSDTYTSSEAAFDNSRHVNRNTRHSYLSGRESHPNHSTSTNWFGGAGIQESSPGNGPKPESERLGYTRRSRENLPVQTEAFAQYFAESYHSSKNTRKGHGWRANDCNVRGSPTSCGPARRDPYDNSESVKGGRCYE